MTWELVRLPVPAAVNRLPSPCREIQNKNIQLFLSRSERVNTEGIGSHRIVEWRRWDFLLYGSERMQRERGLLSLWRASR